MAEFDRVAQRLGRYSGKPIRQSKWSDIENREVAPKNEDDLAVLELMFGTDWPRPPMPPDAAGQIAEAVAEGLARALPALASQMTDALLQVLREDRIAARRELLEWIEKQPR